MVTTLAIRFLFAGSAAIGGAASDLELRERLLADRTNTLAGGLLVCGGEFVKELLVLRMVGSGWRGLVEGTLDKVQFFEGQR